ncbi:MAG: polyprenyl glycosylphosphotransferase, partial [Verrucomicrobiota bacterium]
MKSPRVTAITLLLGDALCLLFFMNVVGMLRGVIPVTTPLLWPLTGPLLLLVGAIYLIDGYKTRTSMLSLDYTSQHLIAIVAALALTLLLTFVVVPAGFPLQQSRAVIALGFLVLAPATLGLRRAVQLRKGGAHRLKPVVFAGDEASRQEFQLECERMKLTQPVITASVAPEDAGSPTSLSTIIADIEAGRIQAEAIVLRESRHEPPGEVSQRLVRLYFAGLPTYTLELFHQVYWRKIPLYRLNQTWLFQEGFQIAREPV